MPAPVPSVSSHHSEPSDAVSVLPFQLSLRPLDDVPCVERDSLDLSVSLDDPDRASYVTTSCHASFPSHLTRYPELAIRAVNRAHHKRYVPRRQVAEWGVLFVGDWCHLAMVVRS